MTNKLEDQTKAKIYWAFEAIAKSDQKQVCPRVLSGDTDWYPPEGVSALPIEFQKAVPEEFRYWEEEDGDRRKGMLDTLRKSWDGESLENLKDVVEGKMDVKFAKADYKKQLIYSVVLSPMEVDSWKDFEKAPEIEDAAHRYLERVWAGERPEVIGKQHEAAINAFPVESYIWNTEPGWLTGVEKTEENKIHTGDWILVIKVLDKAEFKKAVSGEYSGVSMQGFGIRRKPKREDARKL